MLGKLGVSTYIFWGLLGCLNTLRQSVIIIPIDRGFDQELVWSKLYNGDSASGNRPVDAWAAVYSAEINKP